MSQDIPLNLFTVKQPTTGEVIENKRLTPESRGAGSDVRHISIRPKDKFPYLAGQSVGIIMPGVDPLTNKPHRLRLYSIASQHPGDVEGGESVSLCVVRHFWNNPKTDEKQIPGLASNYLCDLKPGDQVTMTGPVGRHFMLPEDFQKRDIIFVATGTGIAPYRGMLKQMYDAGYEGQCQLYFGVAYSDVVLYDDAFTKYAQHSNFSYFKAISREDKNPHPEEVPTRDNKMYVQAKMYAEKDQLIKSLQKPDSLLFLCGLKGMEEGIFPILEKIGASLGVKDAFVKQLKSEQRLKVEVY